MHGKSILATTCVSFPADANLHQSYHSLSRAIDEAVSAFDMMRAEVSDCELKFEGANYMLFGK
jgi:hypothetical protein